MGWVSSSNAINNNCRYGTYVTDADKAAVKSAAEAYSFWYGGKKRHGYVRVTDVGFDLWYSNELQGSTWYVRPGLSYDHDGRNYGTFTNVTSYKNWVSGMLEPRLKCKSNPFGLM